MKKALKEKMVKLIHHCTSCEECRDEDIADHLIANGATIPVRCNDCEYYKPDTTHPIDEDTGWPDYSITLYLSEGECCADKALSYDDYCLRVKADDFCSFADRVDNKRVDTHYRCNGCEQCKIVHCNGGDSFEGCYHEPYHGKWVGEIKSCPKMDGKGGTKENG